MYIVYHIVFFITIFNIFNYRYKLKNKAKYVIISAVMELNKRMKMKKVIILIMIIIFNFSVINAEEELQNDSYNENEDVDIYEEQTVLKVTDELYLQITNQIDDISKLLDNIEDKLNTARNMEEYLTYPAIRLDIDTPYFGIEHIINSKLTIREGVSTFDVASGYSIKDIVNKYQFKIASFDVADIVILTRNVEINEDMTLEDAKTLTVELVEYYSQTKEALDLLNTALSDTFKIYLSDEKDDLISDYTSKVEDSKNLLNEINDEISYLIYFSDFNDDIDTLNAYYDNMYKNKETSEDLLLSIEQMELNIENIDNEIEKITEFKELVNNKYTTALEDIKLDECILNTIDQLNEELEYIELYITNSQTIVNSEIDDEIEEITTSNYLTTSDNIYEAIKEDIIKLEELYNDVILYYYELELIEDENAEEEEVVDEDSLNTDEEMIEDNEINIYNYNENDNIEDYINQVNDILIDIYNKNVTYMINNIQINVKNIKSSANINVYEYSSLKYIYYEMELELDDVYNVYDSRNLIKIIKANNMLKEISEKVIDANYKLLNLDEQSEE